MQALSRVPIVKIVMTLALWCVPLLLFPVALSGAIGFVVPAPRIFLRILGMAYLALVVGYAFGLQSARRGAYPAEVVWVGHSGNERLHRSSAA